MRMNKYPLYVISKGRWESRLTVRALEQMGDVDYHVVVEPQEYKQYAAVIAADRILQLPFSNLGQGSIPARNWCWEHSLSLGSERHWILDDNISGFIRCNRNKKYPVTTGAIFRASEDFVDRYQNVALAGFQYRFFGIARVKSKPFCENTRIYSCILIKNDLTHRWRGRYNEDTDLSIRALRDGFATVLFYIFRINKAATMTMKGGNTDELYSGTNEGAKENDGRWKMAESLREQHPDIVRISRKWGRWQHHVDYSQFKRNKLILKEGVAIPEGVNNYGMVLQVDAEEAEKPAARAPAVEAHVPTRTQTLEELAKLAAIPDFSTWEHGHQLAVCDWVKEDVINLSDAEKLLAELKQTELYIESKDGKLFLKGGSDEERKQWTLRLRPLKEELLALLSVKPEKKQESDWSPKMIALEERTRPSASEMRSWAAKRRNSIKPNKNEVSVT